MHRRDLLRLLCGLPLVLGLPAFADEGDEPTPGALPSTLEAALAFARARGRPLLLVATPAGRDVYARRARLARRLDELLLSAKDEATRLALANLVIVVDLEATLRRAAPELAPALGPDGAVWLLEPARPRKSLEPLAGALDGDEDAAAQLVERVRYLALVPAALGARREAELAALGADRAAAEKDLAALPDSAARLAPRTVQLAASLTLLVATPTTAEPVRASAKELVLRLADGAVPVGARWDEFFGGCGREDPYAEEPCHVKCGMAAVAPEARRYLSILVS